MMHGQQNVELCDLFVWLDTARLFYIKNKLSKLNDKKKDVIKLYLIRWTTPVSRRRITYRTEHVGTTKLQKGDRVDR